MTFSGQARARLGSTFPGSARLDISRLGLGLGSRILGSITSLPEVYQGNTKAEQSRDVTESGLDSTRTRLVGFFDGLGGTRDSNFEYCT